MTTTARWDRVRAVFHEALERPPAERAGFVASACAGDVELLREVESLLAADTAAAGFLETPIHRVSLDESQPDAPVLQAGDRVGGFDVVGALGSGGMGEVYRARDQKLGREVALKLLPRAFAEDPQRLARFERESRILASLNHPHIAAIHSIEQLDGMHLLVLELVEGPTLADRLARGALPLDEAARISIQLARALEAAHDRGIVHRDLKPANIKISAAGIKLLDFGLAKVRDDTRADALVPDAPGARLDRTTDGLILGTCAYMSPEQARGKPVDKRTDIWAFGCVMFEMLTGSRAFSGETPSDTMVAVLEREADWGCLPASTPAAMRRVLRRCLEKDSRDRFHDIADVRLEIEDAIHPRDAAGAAAAGSAGRLRRAGMFVLGAAILIAVGWASRTIVTSGGAPTLPTRFTWSMPAGAGLDSVPAVSPDGQRIAFTAVPGEGKPPRLFVRARGDADARVIAGTDGAKQPFWSPDSRTLAYFARGRLMKVAVDGGSPVQICAAADARGGAWGSKDVIVFQPTTIFSGLLQVSAAGGTPQPATLLDLEQTDNSHRWPMFLPDGVHFLYFVRALSAERRGVYVGRIDRAASVPASLLFRSESEAAYVPMPGAPGGALLSVAEGQIELRPFDAARRVVTGDPRRIGLAAGGNTPYHRMMVSASADMLAFVHSPLPFGQRLASSGRNGEDLKMWTERLTQGWPRISPDGRRLAIQQVEPAPGRLTLWVEDLERGTRMRMVGSGLLPVWSPRGDKLAYNDGPPSRPTLTIGSADGTGDLTPVPCPSLRCDPTDWSRDGQWLLANLFSPKDIDVWMLSVTGAPARPLLNAPFVERDARLSPDGSLVAYVSEEAGHPEVSIQTVGRPTRREVVSVAGGDQPVWSRDGAELFFVDPSGFLRAVRITKDHEGRPGYDASVLLKVPRIGSGHFGTQYDVSPDGRRIYFLDRKTDPPPSEFNVVLGWPGILK
jgi:eukaryotic-like serine/threonine-protein kinase